MASRSVRCVDRHRDVHVRVPGDGLDDVRRRPEVEQPADDGVTQVVEPDVGQAGHDAQPLEVPGEVPRLHRCADRRGEHALTVRAARRRNERAGDEWMRRRRGFGLVLNSHSDEATAERGRVSPTSQYSP
jgi:hypothetical protein